MAKFTFDKCCFCIELRSGCLIIAYLQLIAAIIGTIVLILALIAGGVLTAYHAPAGSSSSSSSSSGSFSFNINGNEYSPYGKTSNTARDKEVEDAIHFAGLFTVIFSAIFLIFVVIALAFVITLLVGLHQSKRGHIKAYLIYSFIFLLISVILWFAGFAQKPIMIGNVIGNLVGILLNLYFLMVIRSYYYELGDSSKGPAIYSAP